MLGIDEQGREVLTYLEGATVGDGQPWPAWVWTDEILVSCGRWIHDYHLAVSGFREDEGARWRMNWGKQGKDDIICHFDIAPYNLVLMPDGVVGFIDWDVAAPGSRLMELAKVANSFSPIHDVATRTALGYRSGQLNNAMMTRVVERTGLLLDAYQLADRRGFVDMMSAAALHSRQRIIRGAAEGDLPLKVLLDSGAADHLIEMRSLLTANRSDLVAGIEG